jgi:hypothetical protein
MFGESALIICQSSEGKLINAVKERMGGRNRAEKKKRVHTTV